MSTPIEPGYFFRPHPMSRISAMRLLDHLKGEFHQLSANDEAQIVLPELPEHPAVIHQKLESQGAPEPQQGNVVPYLLHTHFRVPHIAPVHSTGIEIKKRIGVQVPAVRRVAKRAVIRIVRRREKNRSARARHAMK